MNRILMFTFTIVTFIFVSIFAVSAEDSVVASGICGKDVTWKIYNKSSAAMINYHLAFEGSGGIYAGRADAWCGRRAGNN